jgi:hypothetical protein
MSEDNRDPVRAAERKAFEDALREPMLLDSSDLQWNDERNCYDSFTTHLLWKGWAAARAAISTPAPSLGNETERSGEAVQRPVPTPSVDE